MERDHADNQGGDEGEQMSRGAGSQGVDDNSADTAAAAKIAMPILETRCIENAF